VLQKNKGRSPKRTAFLLCLFRAGLNLPRDFLVEHLGAEIGEGWPSDQNGGDKGEDAKDTHYGDCVAGFYGADDIGCGCHGVSPMVSLTG